MTKKPLSVQLYSLREEAKDNFKAVLEFIAETGFKGVEPAGFNGMTPKEFRSTVDDLGMVISSSHGPWAGPENLNEVIDVAGELGVDLVACGFGRDNFKDMEAIKATAEAVNGMVEVLSKAGLTLFQHNHSWEFEDIDGRIKYDIYAELCPGVKFQIDAYWAANHGSLNPAEQVAKFKDRMPLLHIKDGPLKPDAPMTAFGEGVMDIPSVLAAADPGILRWVIVELDRIDGGIPEMREAIAKSYRYMIENDLAEGNR